jgi:DNA-binding beta-propeller fold protein YncE
MKRNAPLLLALALAAAAALPAYSDSGYHVVSRVTLPGPVSWDYLTLDDHSSHLFISRGTHVAVLDTKNDKVIGDIPDTNGVHGIALDFKDHRGFISDGRANQVTIFDLKTLKTIGAVAVGQGPDCIVYDPATDRVFTFNGAADTATAIDAAHGTVVGTITLPGRPEFAVADGKGHLYDNITDKSEIAAINTSSLTIDHVWPLAPGANPSGIAMDPAHRRLFSVCRNQKLVVMDADTGQVIATPVIGNGPDACRYDPKTSLIFSPNGGDGTMTIIKELSPNLYQTVATVPTQAGARTMALDRRTGDVFTVTATALPATPGTPPWRRQYQPDSFVVLELAP